MTASPVASRLLLAAALAGAIGCRLTPADSSQVVLNGRIEAPVVDLAAKVSGRVVDVRVKEGDRVKAGELLVVLDLGETALLVSRDQQGVEVAKSRLRDLEAGNRQAEIATVEAEVRDREAALHLAQREIERQSTLISKKVGTQRDLDRATTDVERTQAALEGSRERLRLVRDGFRRNLTAQARAEVGRAETQLTASEIIVREAEIRAPADGVILYRLVEPGALVGPGQPTLTMAFANRLYVRTFVPETRMGAIRQGMPAQVRVDAYPDRTFPAHVTEIAPEAEFTPKAVETARERVNLVYAAKVDLDGGWAVPLVPGQPAEVIVSIAVSATPAPPPK